MLAITEGGVILKRNGLVEIRDDDAIRKGWDVGLSLDRFGTGIFRGPSAGLAHLPIRDMLKIDSKGFMAIV